MKHKMSTYIQQHSNKYLVVNSIARRMRDLQSGHKPLVNPLGRDLETVAIEEFKQDKIEVSTKAEE